MMKLDHIQLAMPPGQEAKARSFFCETLGMLEEEKPHPLNERGGCWFRKDDVKLHVGIDNAFAPQTKAHPAFIVPDLQSLAVKLTKNGYEAKWDESLPNRTRFYTSDPFGNRIEFLQEGDGFTQRS